MYLRREKNSQKRRYTMCSRLSRRWKSPWRESKLFKRKNSNSSRKFKRRCTRKLWILKVPRSREKRPLLRGGKTKRTLLLRCMQSRVSALCRGKSTSTTGKRWSWLTTRRCTLKAGTASWALNTKKRASTRLFRVKFQATKNKAWNRWALR